MSFEKILQSIILPFEIIVVSLQGETCLTNTTIYYESTNRQIPLD